MEKFPSYKFFLIILFLSLAGIKISYGQSQCHRIGDNGSDQSTSGNCAPVTLDFSFNYEFDIAVDPSDVQVYIDWGDGTNVIVTPAQDGSNRLFFDTIQHIYPEHGPDCSYEARAYVISDGDHCTSSTQLQEFRSWNTDNENGGVVAAAPERALVCEGDPVYQVFADASDFNCNIIVEPDRPNLESRWVQFIYGTNAAAGDRIPNLYIINEVGDTVQMTDAAGNSLGEYYGPIIEIPYEAHGPNQVSFPVIAPPDGLAGDIFEITLRNWNICNPYDDPYDGLPPTDTVDGDNPPIIAHAWVEIISTPPNVPSSYVEFCANENIVLTASSAADTLHWYSDSTLTNLVGTGTSFDPTQAPFSLDNSVGGEYSFWVTAIQMACESAPLKVEIKIYDNPVVPFAGADQPTCSDTITLNATAPSIGTGVWSSLSSASISNVALNNSFVSGLDYGTNIFTWTVTNGPCVLTDDVEIYRDTPPIQAIAGSDLNLCNQDSIVLYGNSPVSPNYGVWQVLSGSASINNPVDPSSSLTGIVSGETVLEWSLHSISDVCPPTYDTIKILHDITGSPADAGSDVKNCDITSVQLNGNAIPTGGTGTWTLLSGSGSISDNTIPNPNVTSLNDGVNTFEWMLESQYGICPTTRDTVEITVYQTPRQADAGPDQYFCLDTFAVLQGNSPDVGVGTWDIIYNPIGGTPVFLPSVNDSNAVFSVTSDDVSRYELTWTLSNGDCFTRDTVLIDLGAPIDTVYAGEDDSTCGTSIQLQGNAFLRGTGEWTKIQGPGNITFVPNAHTPNAWALITPGDYGDYQLEWRLESGSCGSVADTVSITYHAIPDQPLVLADSSCGPSALNLGSVIGNNGTLNRWYDNQTGGSLIQTGNSYATPVLSITESYWVSTYNETTFCESLRAEVVAKINPIPGKPSSPNVDFCGVSDLIISSSIGSDANTNLWYDSQIGGLLLGVSKNYTDYFDHSQTLWVASYDTITGCQGDRDSVYIEIYTVPDNPVVSDVENCGSTSFALISEMGNNGTTNYWYYSDTTVSPFYTDTTYITPLLDSTTSYWVSTIDESTLCESEKVEVTAVIHPVPVAPNPTDTSVCGAARFELTTPIGEFGNTLRWYDIPVGGSPVAETDTFTTTVIASDKTYYVSTYNDSTFCESPRKQMDIEILEVPAPLIITGLGDVIQGQSEVVYYVIGNAGSSYTWNIPSEITWEDDFGYWVKLGFPNIGSFNISVFETSINGCPGPESNKQINVTDGELTLDIDLGNNAACTGTDFYIEPSLIGGKGPYDIRWTGDTAFLSSTNTLSTYLNAPVEGEYKFYLDVTDMNYKSVRDSVTVYVYESPTANITTPYQIVCVGDTLTINVDVEGPVLKHQWYGQINALSSANIQEPVFQPSANETYNFIYELTDVHQCKATDTIFFDTEQTTAMFTTDAIPQCSPLTANFTNQSVNYDSIVWDFGDETSSTIENPEHLFTNTQTSVKNYKVVLTSISENGCTDQANTYITVFPRPETTIYSDPDTACHPANVLFTATAGNAFYSWDFGDGETYDGGYNVLHTLNNLTSNDTFFEIKLITASSFECYDTAYKTVLVHPTPEADFDIAPKEQMYPDATVSVQNNTVGDWEYSWYFGDGTSSSLEQPRKHTYDFPNNFNVSLVAKSKFCKDSLTQSVLIKPHPPEAKFDPIEPGCMPLTVTFVNTSSYADSYYWDFGDGSVSNKADPTYTYYEPGVYKITLTVEGEGGEDTHSDTSRVFVLPNSYFDLAPRYVYVNDEAVNYFNLSDHGDIFEWDFGDGTTSNQYNPTHVYQEEGTFDVTLKVWTVNDCFDLYVMENAVLVEPFGDIAFPNAFRPLSPIEENRIFSPGIIDNVDEYHLMIFNRWGELLFESTDPDIGWDGYYQGRPAKQDVYVWKVRGTFSSGESFVRTGDVTLLH